MSTINQQAFNNARQLIQRDFGNVTDLPEDLRNTVVNTYYEFCCLELEFNHGPHHHPDYYHATNTVGPKLGWLGNLKKFYDEDVRLRAAVKHLPEIISGMREFKRDGETTGYKLAVSMAIDLFKYRIPRSIYKSPVRLAIERPFYALKVREIPDLWRLI